MLSSQELEMQKEHAPPFSGAPRGSVAVSHGRAGSRGARVREGGSPIALWLASCVTHGQVLPDGTPAPSQMPGRGDRLRHAIPTSARPSSQWDAEVTMLPIEALTPRAAYIHVPFCAHRCGYCNFALVAGRDDLVDGYLEALSIELASLGPPQEVDTLYFGGGDADLLGAV